MRLLLLLTLLLPLNLPAETPEEKGLAIVVAADGRDTGWIDQKADLKMTLRNRQGQESTRELRLSTLEVDGDGDKSLTIFDSPRDIKGTAFLSYTHSLTADDQWLYLPALKRVKRIASANKSGPFVGSEFAYEDLTSQEIEKYSYKWIRDERIDDRDTFVVEQYPVYEYSGYTRRVVWIDKEMYQPLKIEFYDRKNALLKTLAMSEYTQYLERYWRSAKMEMINHQTGKATTLTWADYRFKNGLSDRDFDKNTLKRAR
jgi:outer membrane lipoprotein-sorting protein